MKYLDYLKSKWREIGLILLLSMLFMSMIDGKSKAIADATKPKEVILKPIVKQEVVTPTVIEKAEEFCEPTYLLKTDDFLSRRDVVILDLSTYELFKTRRIDSNRVGYYYRQSGAVKSWYTVFKNEPLKK